MRFDGWKQKTIERQTQETKWNKEKQRLVATSLHRTTIDNSCENCRWLEVSDLQDIDEFVSAIDCSKRKCKWTHFTKNRDEWICDGWVGIGCPDPTWMAIEGKAK